MMRPGAADVPSLHPDVVGSISAGGLGIITLSRPKALNAMTGEMSAAFLALLRSLVHDDRVLAVLVHGSAPRAFSAGGDIKNLRAVLLEDAARGEEMGRLMVRRDGDEGGTQHPRCSAPAESSDDPW